MDRRIVWIGQPAMTTQKQPICSKKKPSALKKPRPEVVQTGQTAHPMIREAAH
jgi:hypothetical protein